MLTETRLQEITLEAEKKYPMVGKIGDLYRARIKMQRQVYIAAKTEDEGRVKELLDALQYIVNTTDDKIAEKEAKAAIANYYSPKP